MPLTCLSSNSVKAALKKLSHSSMLTSISLQSPGLTFPQPLR